MEVSADRFTAWQRDEKPCKKWRTGQQPQGGTWVHMLVTGTLPGKGPSTTQQGEQFSSTVVVLLFFFVPQWHEAFSSHSIWLPLTLPVSWEPEVKDTTAASFVSKHFIFPGHGVGWEGKVGAKNTLDRIWSPLLRLENSDVRQEDVQHQCHCGTSAGKEEGKRRRVGVFVGFKKKKKKIGAGAGAAAFMVIAWQKAKFIWHRISTWHAESVNKFGLLIINSCSRNF